MAANNSSRRALDFILPTAHAAAYSMKVRLLFPLLLAAAMLATGAPAQTNAAATNAALTGGLLQIQEQLHATQLAIEQNRQATADAASKNADALNARLLALEQAVAAQHAGDVEAARQTQRLTLFLAGAFGLASLGIMLLMVYFQWRAFTQLAEISVRPQPAVVGAEAVHQLASPGRVTVETSNGRLLDTVSQLEQRIRELEGGQRILPEAVPAAAAKTPDALAEAQNLLDANAPQPALESLEKILAAQPDHAAALAKKAEALEKLGRDDEALANYNRAIAADGSLAAAYLHKGGLLNRLRRYDEALNCFEQAQAAQEKKAVKIS
jgi:tetratricopeptide (TPR) repeat protein